MVEVEATAEGRVRVLAASTEIGQGTLRSDLARALWKRREGETILFRKPAGEVELTVVAIRWV